MVKGSCFKADTFIPGARLYSGTPGFPFHWLTGVPLMLPSFPLIYQIQKPKISSQSEYTCQGGMSKWLTSDINTPASDFILSISISTGNILSRQVFVSLWSFSPLFLSLKPFPIFAFYLRFCVCVCSFPNIVTILLWPRTCFFSLKLLNFHICMKLENSNFFLVNVVKIRQVTF